MFKPQDMMKKIANQCATFDGKGKLTVDDLYSVIKVQVKVSINIHLNTHFIQNQQDFVHN